MLMLEMMMLTRPEMILSLYILLILLNGKDECQHWCVEMVAGHPKRQQWLEAEAAER